MPALAPHSTELLWSDWVPLRGAPSHPIIPPLPGLYRIGRAGHAFLDYIGQTGVGGMNLKRRLRMLQPVYGSQIPFRDPHTAAPALWSLRQITGQDYHVSVCPLPDVGKQIRLGLEALAIALHRQDHQRSPTANFGRMPAGYQISSFRKGGVRGHPSMVPCQNNAHGIPPIGAFTGQPTDQTWCGHSWSAWVPIARTSEIKGNGLYRIRVQNSHLLIYIGQGKIAQRLRSHRRKVQLSDHAQGEIFGAAQCLECSWVDLPGVLPHQLEEFETDLIGAHLLQTQCVPDAQFLGDSASVG